MISIKMWPNASQRTIQKNNLRNINVCCKIMLSLQHMWVSMAAVCVKMKRINSQTHKQLTISQFKMYQKTMKSYKINAI